MKGHRRLLAFGIGALTILLLGVVKAPMELCTPLGVLFVGYFGAVGIQKFKNPTD